MQFSENFGLKNIMILVDLNQVMISNLMGQLYSSKTNEVDEDLLRHMVLNGIRSYRNKFSEEYGELVICCDDTNNWRKDSFPYYKAHRKTNRDESDLDWPNIFNCLNNIRDELKEFFPYKHIRVNRCEADDIIGTICHTEGVALGDGKEKILVLSGDKDFIQLHGPNVKQYNPVLNKFVGKGEDPVIYIKEHILKGDRSDGVPNVLSDDNVFIEGRRQRPLSKKKIDAWVNEVFMTFTEEEQKNYSRNRRLIDLSCIPPELEEKIINEFIDAKVASRDKILNYFITKKLKTLIEVIDEF